MMMMVMMMMIIIIIVVNEVYLYSAHFCSTDKTLRHGSQFYVQLHQCLPLPHKRSPDGASPDWGCGHLIGAYYSLIYPERTKVVVVVVLGVVLASAAVRIAASKVIKSYISMQTTAAHKFYATDKFWLLHEGVVWVKGVWLGLLSLSSVWLLPPNLPTMS